MKITFAENGWSVAMMLFSPARDKEYIKISLNENVFCNKCSYKKHIITHNKFETIPDEIKWIGNIDDFNNINILEKVELPFKWSQIEWYFYKILRVC